MFSADEYEYEEPDVECKYCGKDGLHWDHDGVRYVLMESKHKIHKCDPKVLNTLAWLSFSGQ